MKVFLSWSGNLSRRLAESLREWLPNVLQAVAPWMSAEDIEKGARWSTDIAGELEETRAGILCITPDNLEAPWLNFEAGALSKTLEKTFVSPYLLNLRPSDLKGPLVQFQATEATKPDTRRLVGTLNKALGEAALPEKQLDKTFEIWWPELQSFLEKLQAEKAPQRPQRSERELLEEILALVRDQAKRSRTEGWLLPTTVEDQPLMIWGSAGSGKSHFPSYYTLFLENLLKADPEAVRVIRRAGGRCKEVEESPDETSERQAKSRPKRKPREREKPNK